LTRRRWIADEVHGNTALLTGEHARHLSRVLRARVGQEFDVATADAVRRGKIVAITDQCVEFVLEEKVAAEPCARLTLVLSIFKFDRMEWAIEKCAELGVARIIPVVARRTDAHLAAAAAKRQERWLRIARQAAEQSRRISPPEIAATIKLRELGRAETAASLIEGVGRGAAAGSSVLKIVLAESQTTTLLRDAVGPSAAEAVLAIGPEGGWTEDELRWFRESGWLTASLGPTILRAETVAIVATALALDAMRARTA